ncbi:hypothetical protein GCM10009682_56010 [Luedemannella flava]|uniref:Uncharacterized protein n=1 Tax=Luedemannella flava TaxID=349316 RepID=A0ABN2MMY9_9ACTN
MITPLVFTGAQDVYGAPFVDISPTGLRFARPATITIDPAVLGLPVDGTQVVVVDPDVPTSTTVPDRVVDGKLVIGLRDVRGAQVRARSITPFGTTADYCTPFASPAGALAAVAYLGAWPAAASPASRSCSRPTPGWTRCAGT